MFSRQGSELSPSQFLTVATLTPVLRANSFCESLCCVRSWAIFLPIMESPPSQFRIRQRARKRVVIMRLKLLPLPIPGRNGCLLMSKRNSSPSARGQARRSTAADFRPSERWMEEGGGEASSCRPRKAARHAQGKKPHPGEPVRARKHQRALPAEPGNAGLQSIPCPRCTASAGRWAQPSRIFCFLRRRKIHHTPYPTPYQQEG